VLLEKLGPCFLFSHVFGLVLCALELDVLALLEIGCGQIRAYKMHGHVLPQ
jgi:hypothetical protein